MRRIRLVVMTGVLAALLAVAPGVASAVTVGPARTPATIVSEGFDTGGTPTYSLAVGTPMSETYWGPITQRYHSGDRGLWCAGTGPAGFAPTTWDYLAHKYQPAVEDPITFEITKKGTDGTAEFLVPQMNGFYSSALSFFYSMPSIGPADKFEVAWAPLPGDVLHTSGDPWITALTLDNGWTKKEYPLSDPAIAESDSHNLSGKTGWFRFQWRTDDTNLSNPNQGATIDDVSITGYRYGPVRNLQIASGSNVNLTWDKPRRYTYGSDLETRTISYRVWRQDLQAVGTVDEYIELTAVTRVTDANRTLTDSSGVAGRAYRYYVQAWDPGTGVGGWGELAAPAVIGTGGLKGIVTSGGNPLAGATVSVPGYTPATTGADGSYLVSDIAPGPYTVTYSKAGYVTTTQAVTIAAGAALDRPAVLAVVAVPVPHTYGTSTTLSGRSSVKVKKYTAYYSGRVSSPAAGPVTISLKRKVGRKWKNAGTVRAYAVNGTFRFRFKPKYKGSWKMTATYGGGTYGIDRYLSSNTTKSIRVK